MAETKLKAFLQTFEQDIPHSASIRFTFKPQDRVVRKPDQKTPSPQTG
jgi:hypothetical protein